MNELNIGDVVLVFDTTDVLDKYTFGVVIDIDLDDNKASYTVKDDDCIIHYNCLYDHDIMTPEDYKLFWKCEAGYIMDEIHDLESNLNEINEKIDDFDKVFNHRNELKLIK